MTAVEDALREALKEGGHASREAYEEGGRALTIMHQPPVGLWLTLTEDCREDPDAREWIHGIGRWLGDQGIEVELQDDGVRVLTPEPRVVELLEGEEA